MAGGQSQHPMSLPVYLVESIGAPNNHHAIFVLTNEKDGSGYKFHVKGSIQLGMLYEATEHHRPEDSPEYLGKSCLGWVDVNDYPRVNDICTGVPPPKKQFRGPKRLYPKEPLRRCQEWVKEAIQALESNGVLHRSTPVVEAP
ncbi:hypothetical protein HYQ46_011095 [Verticillium longisporum]|nr:hypothetical protein HYQ46_011095 [Verticillium longisporum]KAG7118467.1 hypothetical protein HYQ44_005610 [Verticillium longisporum]